MAHRILLITQWFDPEPTPKGLTFARALVRMGYEVEVLTGFPNYPGGRVYPGYRIRPIQRERIDGVEVTRVALYPSHNQSGLRRALNYLSFGFTGTWYCLFCARRPDLIYAYHPPLTVGVIAALARVFRRLPVVLDIQDLWPDTLRVTGMFTSERLLRVVSRACDWVYRHVDQIVVLSPGFKQALVARGVPEAQVEVIYNWCDEESLARGDDALPEGFPGPERFRVVFAGNMGKAQSMGTVLETAALLRERLPEVRIVLVGGGVEVDGLKRAAGERNLDNVAFIPQLPMSRIGSVLRAADVLLVHLRDDPLFRITIPSKTQAYMAVGKPVIMAVPGDAARLVEESGCGVVARPDDPASLSAAIEALATADRNWLASMAQAGRDYYYEHLSLRTGAQRFATIFDRLIADRSA